ncbi:hypothetical protein H8E77_31830, partial [bacterium]|nr:hypothetical protein [bacterium]
MKRSITILHFFLLTSGILYGENPVGGDTTLTVLEDNTLTFAVSDFPFSDEDGDIFVGIFIVDVETNGDLEYAGIDVWAGQFIPDVSLLVFMPNPDENGSPYATFTHRVIDSSGDISDVNTPYTVTLNVTAVNDAPEFTLSTAAVEVLEDFATPEIVTVTPLPVPSDEQWQTVTYSLAPVSVSFANVSINPNTGEVTITSAPDGNGSQGFTVTAVDNGGTANGGDNTYTQTFTLTVTSVNDAPEFTLSTAAVEVLEDFATPEIVTVTPLPVPSDEQWQTVTYSLAPVSVSFANVSINPNTGEVTITSAPDGNGSQGFTVTAVDNGGTANGGDNTYTQTFTLTVIPVNDAPELNNSYMLIMNDINEDDSTNSGTLIDSLLSSVLGFDPIYDVDSLDTYQDTYLGEGIAIIQINTVNCDWQFSIDNGINWNTMENVSGANAVLLASDDETRVRFIPNTNWPTGDENTIGTSDFEFRAWDRTEGTNGDTYNISSQGGTTPFSVNTSTAEINVLAVDDPPVALPISGYVFNENDPEFDDIDPQEITFYLPFEDVDDVWQYVWTAEGYDDVFNVTISGDSAIITHNQDEFFSEEICNEILFRVTDTGTSNQYSDVTSAEFCIIPRQRIELSNNWNLMSLNVYPEVDAVVEMLAPIHENLIFVFDELFNLIRWDSTAWSDGIGNWMATEGYYVKLSANDTLKVSTDSTIAMPFDIPLSAGWNIISFPTQSETGQSVDAVFEDIMSQVVMIFNWNGELFLPGDDSVFVMYPDKAYLVKVLNDVTLILNEDEGPTASPFMARGASRVNTSHGYWGHFTPVWEGTPFVPMTFILNKAQWNYLDLVTGDEIGIFDNNLCVGAYTIPAAGFVPGAQIPTSKDDGSGNGFTEGHTVKFRVWKENFSTEIDVDIFSFTHVVTDSTIPQVFTALSGVDVEIGVQPPSSPASFSAGGSSNQVNLSWSTPSQGNYNVYDNGVPSQAIFYRMSRDGSQLFDNYQSNSYQDGNLSNNTLYDYELQAYSVVDEAQAIFNNALTLPGTPMFTVNVPYVNEITLTWTDAADTGNDDDITYWLERQWSVGEGNYSQGFVSNYDLQSYTDIGLLNSSEFSYRIKAYNSTGYSSWSPYITEMTLTPSGNVPIVVVVSSDTVTRTCVPPQNLVTLFWEEAVDAVDYRLYERNLLVEENIIDFMFTDGLWENDHLLETNTTYRYVVTGMNAIGESLPSDLWVTVTLPEIAPPVPPDFSVEGGQNQNALSWSASIGPGYPVGGNAVIYNVYRFLPDGFHPDSIGIDDIYSSTPDTFFINSNLEDNQNYLYAVSGVNSEGLEGSLTEILYCITEPQSPPTTPENINAIGGNQQVYLSWSPSTGSPPITYQVYRYGDVFVGETSSTSFTDQELSKSTEYSYTVVAFNEVGPSAPSAMVYATTSSQTSLLAPYPPDTLTSELSVPSRTSNYIDGKVTLNWSAAYFQNDPFELIYEGNPFNAMVFVVTDVSFEDGSSNISDGDVIGVYDGDLCVGEGTWPLGNNELIASQDDGSGNGFSPGNSVYFKIWKDGFVRTVIESPGQVFNGLEVKSVELTVYNDTYNLYRNGSILTPALTEIAYEDTMIESEMDYVYQVSATNVLGDVYESNPSDTSSVSTYVVPGNPPDLDLIYDQTIDEDNTLTLTLSATDPDGDEIIFFAHPVIDTAPVACFVAGNNLTVIPAPDHYGVFKIEVIAYDDTLYYESNTLTDTVNFDLYVNSINDPPILLNQLIDDIEIFEDSTGYYSLIYDYNSQGLLPTLYQQGFQIDISNMFIDVDEIVMGEEHFTYDFDTLNVITPTNGAVEDSLFRIKTMGDTIKFDFQPDMYGEVNLVIHAVDSLGTSASDTINIIVEPVNDSPRFVPGYPQLDTNVFWVNDIVFTIGNIYDIDSESPDSSFQWLASDYQSSGYYQIGSNENRLTLTPGLDLLSHKYIKCEITAIDNDNGSTTYFTNSNQGIQVKNSSPSGGEVTDGDVYALLSTDETGEITFTSGNTQDADQDSLFFVWSLDNGWSENNYTMHYLYSQRQDIISNIPPGYHDLVLTITDGYGGEYTSEWEIKVRHATLESANQPYMVDDTLRTCAPISIKNGEVQGSINANNDIYLKLSPDTLGLIWDLKNIVFSGPVDTITYDNGDSSVVIIDIENEEDSLTNMQVHWITIDSLQIVGFDVDNTLDSG